MVQFAEKSQKTDNCSFIHALQASADLLQKCETVATM